MSTSRSPRRFHQTSKSPLPAAADSQTQQPTRHTSGPMVVYECKNCDMVSKDTDRMYSHLEDQHCRKRPRGRDRSLNYRSLAMEGFLASSFQKTIYHPEVFLDEGSQGAADTYTAYACTLCHYQHLNNQQVRKHGTMSHFLEIPVFSCVYCKTAVADRAVFDKHRQMRHGSKKVDFSFDCKALTLLNDFLSESIYQIHVQKAGMLEVIKDREVNFIHYTDEVLQDMQGEEPEDESSSSSSLWKTKDDSCISPNGNSLKITEGAESSPMAVEFVNEGLGAPRNTVRCILDAMMQHKDGARKRYLKGTIEELLKGNYEQTANTKASQAPAGDTSDMNQGKDNGKDADISVDSEIIPVTLIKTKCTENSKEGKNDDDDDDDDDYEEEEEEEEEEDEEEEMEVELSVMKTGSENLQVVSEKEEGKGEKGRTTEELVPPKRKRGRPRKTPVKDKGYRPIVPVGASSTEKGVILPEKVNAKPVEPDPGLTPRRYNFRQRKKAKSFSDDEEEKSEEEEQEKADESKKPKLIVDKFTEVANEQQKFIAKTFRKLLPSNKNLKPIVVQPPEKSKPRSLPKAKMLTVTSAVSMPVPATLPISVTTSVSPQVKKTQSFLMVNGQLVPIMQQQAGTTSTVNLTQPLQFVTPSAPRPTTFQSPQIIQLPIQQTQQQVPFRFNIQQPQQTFVLNLGQQQQQAQVFPMLNQPVQQQQFIIQQGGSGLQQNPQSIQVIPQNNAAIIPGMSAPQFPLVIRPGVSPQVQQTSLPQTNIQNILNLGQIVNQPQQQMLLKSPSAPFVVSSTAATSGTSILPSIPQVQPIVIEPKEDLSAAESSSKLSSPSLLYTEKPSKIISHYFIGFHICRRCLQIFLTSDSLDKHVYKEELDKDPSLALPFSKIKNYLGQFAITPLVTVLQRGCEWDIPVYRCGECNIVHILQSHMKEHIEDHGKGIKCVRESLWSPSDLRVICTRGWTSSLKMHCKAQPLWAMNYFGSTNKRDYFKTWSNVKLKKTLISDLEMYDTIAKADGIAQKQKPKQASSTKEYKFVSLPQSVPQVVGSLPGAVIAQPGANTQSGIITQPGAITVHSGMQGSVAGLNPIQILPQYALQTHPQRPPTQVMQGTRIIQVPQMSQILQLQQQQPVAPPPIQILQDGQPLTQPMHIVQQAQMQSPEAAATAGSSRDLSEGDDMGKPDVERVEPDSSCQVEEDGVKTKSKSNLLLAPNILSCFSEGEEGEGSLDGKLLGKIPSEDHDMTDTGAGEVDESENQTGEAFACRLCAYSCDTERRVKQHLMSSHISVNMYPFRCVNCSYESPSTLRLAQHILYKHQKQAKKNPPRLAKDMEKDKELWPKIMPDENKYKRFKQELDCLFRNCVEKC